MTQDTPTQQADDVRASSRATAVEPVPVSPLRDGIPDAAYDKTGRKIMVGDVLKVFHFQGARWRKHYFMFKQVLGTRKYGDGKHEYLRISHLNMKDVDDNDGGYTLAQDGAVHPEIEIIQGLDWHHDRPRLAQVIKARGDQK